MASRIDWAETLEKETTTLQAMNAFLAQNEYATKPSWLGFLRALGFFESTARYGIRGGSNNAYYGKYQFGSEGATELETIGFWSSAEATALGFTGAVDMN